MKATLSFSEGEMNELTMAMNGPTYFNALFGIKQLIRTHLKHGDLSLDEEKLLEEIRSMIPDLDDVD